ncbi:conserved hypothetical protein [Tenacibaculum sp. 190524A02b]|uniref:Uncharacterized protein n=1 Tax=Tenacibaculum vairaonense TaxID=3137860 RepID=A0ABM9PHT9_9FLAO
MFLTTIQKTTLTLFFFIITNSYSQLDAGALLGLPTATTTTEMNGITGATAGAILYNAEENRIFVYTGTVWEGLNSAGWLLNGNSDATGTSFLGTTNAIDLVFRTNNTENLRIRQSNGYIGLNEPTPTSPLHIVRDLADGIGIIRVEGTEPDINFNDTDGGFNTFTFENNGQPRFAFGRRNTDNFYITRNSGGSWFDQTFNITRNDGFVGINTDSPQAYIDINSNTNVPLRLRPNTSTPTGTNNGEFFVANNGLLHAFDATRSKWLSVDRFNVFWGRNSNNTTNQYLRQINGAQSNNTGWRMIRNGTITAISVQGNINQTYTVEIRKNDTATVITSITVTNSQGNHDTTINIDFNEGDFLQCYLNGTSIDYPQVMVEIAWRQ